jgi:signal transduction histidine kinase
VQISGRAIIAVLAVTLLFTLYFGRTISDPLLELATTAQSITDSGNYDLKARTSYPDETGVLASAFNEMLKEVRKRDNALMMANEGLEEKITLRTAQLEEAKRKAELANEAKSEFLRNMSHEFRTPLHAILSFSTYGVKEYQTSAREELKKYFELMKKSSERLGKLVNEVLDLARLEHGSQPLLTAYYDLRELADNVAESMESLLKNKNITLNVEHAPAPVGTLCDSDKILQVITNLFSNAIKFTPPGRTITLKTHIHRSGATEEALLSLADEGVGIPEEEKEMIFESFRQSTRTNTGAGGTGLGLAICRNIIAAHHGRVWAENNAPGNGACFTFCLPATTKERIHPPMIPPQETSYEPLYKA